MLKIIIFSLFIISYNVFSNEQEIETIDLIREQKVDLRKAKDLNKLVNRISNSRLALLGESTHGTSEYYKWRAEISKLLIKSNSYSFIAVEGDWASIYRLNQYVKWQNDSKNDAISIMKTFSRWPEWLWANHETAELIEWIRKYNRKLPAEKQIGFYGIDVYGQWDALDELTEYIKKYHFGSSTQLIDKLSCYRLYHNDDRRYMNAVMSGAANCSNDLKNAVQFFYQIKNSIEGTDLSSFQNAKQNAYVVKNAEKFFRKSIFNNAAAWNSRVNHMYETILRLLDNYGTNSKGIIWAHNTHIGDASATDMLHNGINNIGNLFRNKFGRNNVCLVGFGTYTGKVCAGLQWDTPMRIMNIPEANLSSIENLLYRASNKNYYLIFNDEIKQNLYFANRIPHRAIGVTYNPENEQGNYVPSVLADRYDAFIFIPYSNELNTFAR